MFLCKKIIDRSPLRQGFQILVVFHHQLKAIPGGFPLYGEMRSVKALIDGVGYDAQQKNLGFDRPSLSFCFPNGLVEKVKVDKHLNV